MITVRPVGELTPLEHAQLVSRFWNRLGVWSRRVTAARYGRSSFHCVLVREAQPASRKGATGVGEHFHVLVHVPAAMRIKLTRAITRWHPDDDTHVRTADQSVEWTPSGKIKSALGYLTKQRTTQAQWQTPYRRQAGGLVVGKRYRITTNLRAEPRPVTLTAVAV